MNCEQIREQLPLYAGEDLESSEMALVGEHVSDCADCGNELQRYVDGRGVLTPVRPELPADFWGGYNQELFARIDAAPEEPALLTELAGPRPTLPADFWSGYTEEILVRATRPTLARPRSRRLFKVALAASVMLAVVLSLRFLPNSQPAVEMVIGRAGGDLPTLPIAKANNPVAVTPVKTGIRYQLQNDPVRRVGWRSSGGINVANVPQAGGSKARYMLEEAHAPKQDGDQRSFSF